MSHDHGEHDRPDSHGHGDHGGNNGHGHAHANDQGLSGSLRYLRHAPSMWRSAVNNAAIELLAPGPDETVLDIGAGMGAGSFKAARKGAKVVAVEPTLFLRSILVARRLFQKNRKRIAVRSGAAENLPVNDGSVDAVWAVNTMHHWIDGSAAANEIARVLHPGGRALLVDEDFNDPSHPDFEKFGAQNHDPSTGDNSHHGFTMIDADAMGALLTSAGLKEVVAGKRLLEGRPAIIVTGTA